ncbi:MAG: hypothetical protein AAF702_01555 [Chloroflexota bacterium]
MNRVREIPRRILWFFAGVGISELVGIPFIGGLLARLLDGVSVGAAATADYIRYHSLDEANHVMNAQILQGARVERFYQNDDGSVVIKYDTTNYTGDDIAADTIEALSADWILENVL